MCEHQLHHQHQVQCGTKSNLTAMDLDLHGIRHSEVDRLVENFIYLNQASMPLKIICGNSNTMIQLVLEVVERIGCETSRLQYGTIVVDKIR